MLSSELTKELCKSGISELAARKRVSRRGSGVSALYGLPFPKKAKFLYLDDQFGTHIFYDALYEAIENNAPAYAAALSGLRAKSGIILKEHFCIISGSPVAQKNRYLVTLF